MSLTILFECDGPYGDNFWGQIIKDNYWTPKKNNYNRMFDSGSWIFPEMRTQEERSPNCEMACSPQSAKKCFLLLPPLFLNLLLLCCSPWQFVSAQKHIDSLPGFSGQLPFALETGYAQQTHLFLIPILY
jgi:hypothetical protein